MKQNKTRILIAEGDGLSRAALVECLLEQGYWIEPVSNGFDAATALENPQLPGVAIVDLGLPGVTGRNLISQMLASERLKGVPIIATGLDTPFARLPPGVSFLRKPCPPELLARTVKELGQDSVNDFYATPARQSMPARAN